MGEKRGNTGKLENPYNDNGILEVYHDEIEYSTPLTITPRSIWNVSSAGVMPFALITISASKFLIQQDLIKAKIRQNLVYICKGNPFEMAKLIAPPDFSGFMWKDIQEEYVRKAASLWDNV